MQKTRVALRLFVFMFLNVGRWCLLFNKVAMCSLIDCRFYIGTVHLQWSEQVCSLLNQCQENSGVNSSGSITKSAFLFFSTPQAAGAAPGFWCSGRCPAACLTYMSERAPRLTPGLFFVFLVAVGFTCPGLIINTGCELQMSLPWL